MFNVFENTTAKLNKKYCWFTNVVDLLNGLLTDIIY